MFSLHPRDELVFGNPTTISKSDKILHDLFADHRDSMATNNSNLLNNSSNSKQQKGSEAKKPRYFRQQRLRESKSDECIFRKVLHREIERKRRQEMSELYVALRALLPPHQIKGKRSVSDHMQEAVNHIQHMQKKVEELRIRRDKLKKLCNVTKSGSPNIGGDNLANFVTVNPVHYGVEILISCSCKSYSELGLSKVFAELMQSELNVFSCVSTRTKESFLHNIQAEAVDMASLDLSVLQERLTSTINK